MDLLVLNLDIGYLGYWLVNIPIRHRKTKKTPKPTKKKPCTVNLFSHDQNINCDIFGTWSERDGRGRQVKIVKIKTNRSIEPTKENGGQQSSGILKKSPLGSILAIGKIVWLCMKPLCERQIGKKKKEKRKKKTHQVRLVHSADFRFLTWDCCIWTLIHRGRGLWFLQVSVQGLPAGWVDFESLSQDLYGNIGKSRGRPLTRQHLHNIWGLVCLN